MSWIQSIANGISKAFENTRPALKSIPALLLVCELKRRPGLSAIALASAIIRRLPEAGIETGKNPDGSSNKVCQMVRIISEEIVKEFKDNAKITSLIKPNTIISEGVGGNAGGPVYVTSRNTILMTTDGLLQ